MGKIENKKDMIHYYHDKQRKLNLVFYENATLSYPVHTHAEHDTIGYVLEGELDLETNNQTVIYKQGSSFVIKADKAHAFRPNNDKAYTMICICVEKEYLQISEFEDIQKTLDEQLKKLPCDFKDIENCRKKLDNELFLLSAEFKSASMLSDGSTRELKQRILQAPEDALSIEQMSKCIHVSSFHMIRQFKMEMGITPHQFQIQSRVRNAQKLLEDGKSVTEVAFETGFCDQSHLHRCFKRVVGITPTEYKKVVS